MIKKIATGLLAFSVAVCTVRAASTVPADVNPGRLRAGIAVGFSYDVLRDPANVSFEVPEGRASFNVPISLQLPKSVGDMLSGSLAEAGLDTSANFEPSFKAGQQLNLGFRVNVPLAGGVGTFAYSNNVDIDYMTVLGNSDIAMDTTIDKMKLKLKGAIDVPAGLQLGWRTLTFGYAYQPFRGMILALNMNRHMFRFAGNANVSVDLLGNMKVDLDQISIEKRLNYNSNKLYGYAGSEYTADAWTPSFALKFWRFGAVSRFGFDTKAHGTFAARYSLPFFVDKKTFQPTLTPDNMAAIQDSLPFLNDLIAGKTDSVVYDSKTDADWKLPQGHTVSFDLVKNKLFVSYTKILGDLEMKHVYEGNDGNLADTADNRTDLDVAISVDNVFVLGGRFRSSQFNIGFFTMDARIANDSNVIGNSLDKSLQILGKPTFPIFSVGSSLGGAMRMLLQFDILPFPSFKSGVVYYF